jgi:tRNA threonylcarbamoyl adenosine modification protein YeaZ
VTYGLAIHTSSPDLGFALEQVALDRAAEDRRSLNQSLGRAISNQIHSQLQAFLAPQTWQDLAFIAVAIGPGGFTGTRIGVVLARTLAQQLDIPLYGISSFAAIAQAENQSLLALEMPAQQGSLFSAIYQGTSPLVADSAMVPEDWAKTREEYPGHHHLVVDPSQGQYATNLLAMARVRYLEGDRPHWSLTLPYYGQHPVKP